MRPIDMGGTSHPQMRADGGIATGRLVAEANSLRGAVTHAAQGLLFSGGGGEEAAAVAALAQRYLLDVAPQRMAESADLRTGLFLREGARQVFLFQVSRAGAPARAVAVTVAGRAEGVAGWEVAEQMQAALQGEGIQVTVGEDGKLALHGVTAYTMRSVGLSDVLRGPVLQFDNSALYRAAGAARYVPPGAGEREVLTFRTAGGAEVTVTLDAGNAGTPRQALETLNGALREAGIYALRNAAGTGIEFQSVDVFRVVVAGAKTGVFVGAAPVMEEAVRRAAWGGESVGEWAGRMLRRVAEMLRGWAGVTGGEGDRAGRKGLGSAGAARAGMDLAPALAEELQGRGGVDPQRARQLAESIVAKLPGAEPAGEAAAQGKRQEFHTGLPFLVPARRERQANRFEAPDEVADRLKRERDGWERKRAGAAGMVAAIEERMAYLSFRIEEKLGELRGY